MTARCYFRAGGNELCDGVKCEAGVFDDENEEQLIADGWVKSPHDLSAPSKKAPDPDPVLDELRAKAKELKIKGAHLMGEEKLREVLGLNDDSQEE